MYKILIVEDEALELKALTDILSSQQDLFEEVYSADNEEDAVELAAFRHPDIILMDIHLGNANGLELSRQILSENPAVKIIVTTAHDQFQYALNALKIGVADYLLKPLPTDTLLACIYKQIQAIEEEKANLLREANLRSNVEKLKDVLSYTLTGSIINNASAHRIRKIISSIGIPHSHSIIFVMEAFVPNLELSATELTVIKKLIVDFLADLNLGFKAYFDILSSEYITICAFMNETTAYNDLQTAKKIRTAIASSLKVSVRIGISNPVSGVQLLNAAYKQAILALTVGDQTVNRYSDYLAANMKPIEAQDYLPEIVSAILKNDSASLDKVLSAITRCLTTQEHSLTFAKTYCIRLWTGIIKHIESRISAKEFTTDEMLRITLLQMIDSPSIPELTAVLKAGTDSLYGRVLDVMQSTVSHITKRSQEYINENYAQALTLNSIASTLKMSPYYLSHLFKKELGINVIEYLNQVRIQNAQRLLLETTDSIQEISIKVGFTDANYFCRVFRKITSCPPSAYRSKGVR